MPPGLCVRAKLVISSLAKDGRWNYRLLPLSGFAAIAGSSRFICCVSDIPCKAMQSCKAAVILPKATLPFCANIILDNMLIKLTQQKFYSSGQ